MKKILLVSLLILFGGIANADDKPAQIQLTDQQVLALAEGFVQRGETAAAIQLYGMLLRNPNQEIRIEAVFQLAGIAMARGDLDTAIEYYRAILDRNPELTRVRLELARAHFMNRDFRAAEFHFQFVRADSELPPEVAQRVDMFLALIRQQKNWTLDVGFALIPDSNINHVSGATEECVNTMFGFLCRPLEDKKSGVGVRLSAEGNYFTRITRRWSIRSTIGLSALDFPGGDFRDYSLRLASGPRYVFDKGEISVQPNYSSRWYRGEHFSHSYGLGTDTNWQVGGRWILGGGAFWRTTVFNDERMNEIFGNGNDWGVYVRPRYYLDSRSFVMAGLGYNQNDAKYDYHRSDSINYSLGYFREFSFGLTSFSRVDLINTRFEGERLFPMKNGDIASLRRNDWTTQLSTRLSHRRLQKWNMTPALSYTYIRRDSNVWSGEFDKHRVELEIIRRF
jgi:Tfp pilus assembly protein PilF